MGGCYGWMLIGTRPAPPHVVHDRQLAVRPLGQDLAVPVNRAAACEMTLRIKQRLCRGRSASYCDFHARWVQERKETRSTQTARYGKRKRGRGLRKRSSRSGNAQKTLQTRRKSVKTQKPILQSGVFLLFDPPCVNITVQPGTPGHTSGGRPRPMHCALCILSLLPLSFFSFPQR